jgi:hypothetical protein
VTELFEKSPIQDEDGKKKKKGAKKPAEAPAGGESASDYLARLRDGESEFILRSLDCVSCDQCGAPADLEYVFEFKKFKTWQVRCGWWCQHSWIVDEIPGVLNSSPDIPAASFRLHAGRFAGVTIGEAWEAGNAWYIESVASGVVKEAKAARLACQEFLNAKTG